MLDMIPLNSRERNIFQYFDNLEKNLFGADRFGMLKGVPGQFQTDIVDKGSHFELQAELPGFTKEDIKVDVDQGCLTIHAQREETAEEKQETYVRRERRYGSYSRSFDITGIDPDRISATYQNGILCLCLPKLEALPTPPVRRIEID